MAMNERSLGRRLLAWWILIGGIILLTFGSAFAADEEENRQNLVYSYEFGIGGILGYALVLGFVLLIARGLDWRETFAFRRPTSWRTAGLLTAGLLVAILIVGGILERIFHAGEEQGLDPAGWQSDRIGAFALSALAIVIAAPLTEELAYRGLGYFLLSQFGNWAAIVVTGLAFALSHGIVVGIPVFFVIGAGLAYLRFRTNSIYPPLLFHAAFNGLQLGIGVVG